VIVRNEGDVHMNMGTLARDKGFLRGIVNTDFSIPDWVSAGELCLELMPNFRSSDAELRDELSYTILENILKRESFTPQELEMLLAVSVSEDYLFWRIGECGTDSVFARAFSILVVAAIIGIDASRKLLRPDQIQHTTKTVMDYIHLERDYRGYVEHKGWAHSVAHMSYALTTCTHHPFTTAEERTEILDRIFELATLTVPLTYMEADHLSRVVFCMIRDEHIDIEYLHSWIKRFDLELDRTSEMVLRNVNASDLLKSLYFLLHWEQSNHVLASTISEQVKKLNIFYRF
jgi:hypothetical protein